jgi:hypothetical protein
MAGTFTRRNLIKIGGGAIAAAALPARVFAQAAPLSEHQKAILDIARREVDKAGSVLWRTDIAGIADFAAHSSIPRFHFANLEAGTVRSFLVSHGTGSDPDHTGMLQNFSNDVGSNATSRGAYISWEWYKGRYGTSIRLGGLDPDNSNALDRAIVMHAAEYARPEHVAKWGRLGRSNGCFAMGPEDFNEALWHLSGGRLLYADRLGLTDTPPAAVPETAPAPEAPSTIL